MPEPILYSELRAGKARNGDGLFFQGGSWKAPLIRWWTNDCPHPFWRWLSLAPWQHSEIVVWDAVVDAFPLTWGNREGGCCSRPDVLSDLVRLCSWGSVVGGPRKIPLYSLIQRYNQRGGKAFWAPLEKDPWNLGHERLDKGRGLRCPPPAHCNLDAFRQRIIERANSHWGYHYPKASKQWLRTACRNWFAGKVDADPQGDVCWEFHAFCLGLPDPAAWYAKEIQECGLHGEPREIILDGD